VKVFDVTPTLELYPKDNTDSRKMEMLKYFLSTEGYKKRNKEAK